MQKKTNSSKNEEKDDLEDMDLRDITEGDGEKGGQSVDDLFEEERKKNQRALQDDVKKALSRPAVSRANLHTTNTKELSEAMLTAGAVQQKTVEEVWEESTDDSGEVKSRKLIIMVCALITLIAVVGGWAIWKSTHDEKANEEALVAQENERKQRALDKRLLEKALVDVSQVMDSYLSATTVDQKCECIYQAESQRNDIEQHYEKHGGVKVTSDYDINAVLPIKLNGVQIWEVFLKGKINGVDKTRNYYVRNNVEGEYKVDWKADVAFQENNVEEFIEKRSKEATAIKFEVDLKPKLPTYNWGFKDTEYEVLSLVVPNSDMVFWGYIRKNSLEHKELGRFIKKDKSGMLLDGGMKRLYILKVRFLEDSPRENDRYVLIDDLVSRRWIMPDE